MDEKKQIDIELSVEVAGGIYSNLQIVQHSATEFIVDFIQVMPGVPKAQVKSRVVLAPIHAKKLLHALQENIATYEKNNGNISDSNTINFPVINPIGKA